MTTFLKLPPDLAEKLWCPICKSRLDAAKDVCVCTAFQCRMDFPVIDGIPVLINEANSIFLISDFSSRTDTYFTTRSKLERYGKMFLPTIDRNLKVKANLLKFKELLFKENTKPRVLIIGGSRVGRSLDIILSQESIEFVESDVAFGPRSNLICDAHDIPFEDETFDGVVLQAVLEHVVDPYRCVEETYRVLKKTGLVYAESPFLQRVHGGRYDFTRFTHLGHRRLFRRFEEIGSGAFSGPGMALAWSYGGFLLSFTQSRFSRVIVNVFVRLTAWWLQFVDYYLINKPGAYDNASAYFFMGRKSSKTISDREIIQGYKGRYHV